MQQRIFNTSVITEKRLAYLEGLRSFHIQVQKIIREYTSTPGYSTERLLQEIIDFIRSRFDIYTVHIFMLDKISEEMVLLLGSGDREVYLPYLKQFRVKLGVGITGSCAKFGSTIVVNDVSKDSRYIRGPLQKTKAELCIPLRIQKEIVGVLNLEDEHVGRFTPELVELMEGIALDIGFVLETKKLYDDIRRYSEQLEKRVVEKSDQIRETEIRYKRLLEDATDPILTIDLEGVITWANQAMGWLLGIQTDKIVGQNLAKFLRKGTIHHLYYALREVLDGKTIRDIQLEFVTSRKTIRIVDASFSMVRMEHGSSIEIVMRDITQRKLEDDIKRGYIQELEREVDTKTHQIKETQRAAIMAIATLAESIDTDTTGHLERMRNYSRILSEELSKLPKYKDVLTQEYIELIYELSPLHDLGKIGIKDTLLLKPGKLSEEEFEDIKRHTEIGARALKIAGGFVRRASIFSIAEMIARFHHERFDGTGYPAVSVDGRIVRPLRGEEIPLCARIVSLADVYDALTSKRPYKDAWTHEIAREVIVKESGKQFDPDVVQAFLARQDDFLRIRRQFPISEITEVKPFEG
jgi:PAS domain S-box-containing protein